jgi:catechol 2,3-dioxygenase-like lactoylglutathione lyase family enzyme
MAAKGIFYVFIYASDIARSKRFYTEALGWKLDTDEAGVAGFVFGTGYLIIHEDNRSASQRVYGGGMHVEVQVSDIDAEHARLKALEVDVSPIRDQPWGERQFDFRDPDGYPWHYGQDSGR